MNGNEFKKIRERLELSQSELAELLCYSSKQAISNVEQGSKKPGRLVSTLMRVFVSLPEKRSLELRSLIKELLEHENRKGGASR